MNPKLILLLALFGFVAVGCNEKKKLEALLASPDETNPAIVWLDWGGEMKIESENISPQLGKGISSVDEIVGMIQLYRCNPVYVVCGMGVLSVGDPDKAVVLKMKTVQERLRKEKIEVSEIIEAHNAFPTPESDYGIVCDLALKIHQKHEADAKK